MPKIDFSKVDDTKGFNPLPIGEYLCRVDDIEELFTQRNDEMWRLRFEVVEGKHAGRYIYDNLVFSAAAMKRVKLICSRLGLNTYGEIDLTPDLLQGRRCYVSVLIEEYTDNNGNIKKRNVVPFAGYEQAEKEETEDEKDQMPF